MDLAPGFEGKNNGHKICRLKKSLYGLKQSPRAWFDCFTKTVKSYGFLQGQTDHTLFFKHSYGNITILIVYIDHIILTYVDFEERDLKKFLASDFDIKDLGQLRYFLGMEVARSKKGIVVSQRKYVINVLKEIGLLGCKPPVTLIDPNLKFAKERGGEPVDRGRYQRMVGKLIYISYTRPNIAFM